MLDNITLKVGQGVSLFAEEGSSECASVLLPLLCVCVCLYCFSLCLSNLLSFYPALHASASFWDESRSGKTGPFFHLPLSSVLPLLLPHPMYPHLFHCNLHHPYVLLLTTKPQPQAIRNKLTNLPSLSNTHTQTHNPSLTPKVTLPPNEHRVKAAGTEW